MQDVVPQPSTPQQMIADINTLIENGLARFIADGRDVAYVMRVADSGIRNVESMLDELRETLRVMRLGIPQNVVCMWESDTFDEKAERAVVLCKSPAKGVELVEGFLRDLARVAPMFWFSPRYWWRMRRTWQLRRRYEKLLDVAKKWPKFDHDRVTEARKSIAAGHAVELKDVLRELHAQD